MIVDDRLRQDLEGRGCLFAAVGRIYGRTPITKGRAVIAARYLRYHSLASEQNEGPASQCFQGMRGLRGGGDGGI